MKSISFALLSSVLLSAAFPVLSQTAPAAATAAPTPDWTITGNAGLFSDYRFRGFSQTGYKPAFQGGVDIAHSSGFYVGNWNSNVESGLYNGASLEMDFYGGYKKAFGDYGIDLGGIYYYYPNSGAIGTTKIKNGELYVGVNYKTISAKYYYATTKYFSLGAPPTSPVDINSKGSGYLDLTATYDLGNGWGVQGHYGRQNIRNGRALFAAGQVFSDSNSVDDYKLGVSKDLSGWLVSGAVIGTSKSGYFRTAESGFTSGAGRSRLLVSVAKTF